MEHGLKNEYLYSAYKISATFVDDVGNVKLLPGTCFFVKNKRGVLCLVTNRHMLDIHYKDQNSKFIKYDLKSVRISGKASPDNDAYPKEDVEFLIDASIIKFHSDPRNDIACIINPMPIDQNARIDYFIHYNMIAEIGDFHRKLLVCDFLAFPGYPDWHDKAGRRPIIRTGTISSDPRFDYSYRKGNGVVAVEGNCIAYEAFSYGGSSGSPVFALQKGVRLNDRTKSVGFRGLLLMGINAGHLYAPNNSHSGISYLYKSTAILDVIDVEVST